MEEFLMISEYLLRLSARDRDRRRSQQEVFIYKPHVKPTLNSFGDNSTKPKPVSRKKARRIVQRRKSP